MNGPLLRNPLIHRRKKFLKAYLVLVTDLWACTNFEEQYSGNSLQGSYMAGVYYPDKTRVGWWKNGYPEYFAKVLNSTNWIGINIDIEGTPLIWQSAPFPNSAVYLI